jgi:hypothetical protein
LKIIWDLDIDIWVLPTVHQMLNNSAGCGVFSIQHRYRALKELRLPAGRQVKKIHVVERQKRKSV